MLTVAEDLEKLLEKAKEGRYTGARVAIGPTAYILRQLCPISPQWMSYSLYMRNFTCQYEVL